MSRQWIPSLTIGRKVFMTFLSLALMVGICGTSGVIFIERITSSISVFSDITSPLLIESMALIDNADHMRVTALDDSHKHSSQNPLPELRQLDAEGQAHVAKLKRLSFGTEIWSGFEPLEQLQSDFVDALQEIMKARTAKILMDRATADFYVHINREARLADEDILKLARRFDSQISEHIAVARLDVEELQQSYNLAHVTARSHYLAQSILSVEGELDLTLLEKEALQLFVTASAIRQKLEMSALGRGQQPLLAQIDASVSALQAAFIGPDGLVAKRMEALRANSRLGARQKKFSEIEARYIDVLTGVALAVRNGNDNAVIRTARTISEGRTVIVAVVAIAIILGIIAALFLSRSITAPLSRLTKHVRAIREHGDIIEISDPSLTQVHDELGDLSRSFNAMTRELVEAREQLVAKSEAELGKQVTRLETALTHMSQGLCMFDTNGVLVVSNERYLQMYDLTADVVKPGTTFLDILKIRASQGHFKGDPASHVANLQKEIKQGKTDTLIVGANRDRAIRIINSAMPNGGWVSTHEDITEQRNAQAKISHMALHDALTNLPNRVLFREQMEARLSELGRQQQFAVLCIDLDRFKNVNDTFGHASGDQLLRQVADRMRKLLREGDVLARLGGDEFVVLQGHVNQAADASALASRLIEDIGTPFDLDGQHAAIGVSIGIALAPGDATNSDQLLKSADMALYRAKAEGKGAYRFFEPEMDRLMQARRSLESDLRTALANNEFELYYQPLINLQTENICSFEALLRWNHPERGLIPPLDFIPLAEETNLIVPIGEWVIRQACEEAMKWPSEITVAINLSPVQFKMPNLSQIVMSALAHSGLAAERLELEITESVLLVENASTLKILHQLRRLGVRISMDDFGTGYSSLSYLRSFPFDKIKIDRSFVHDIQQSEDSKAIVRAVTGLGASLGMTTTGEGVETREELEYLRGEGCTEAQGYFFSKPKPAKEVLTMLAERNAVLIAVA
jgi:diguanylate cyclase (GGDEF)-like protein